MTSPISNPDRSAPDYLNHLNPSQRQAVEHYCGPLLVVAGAGSGKTRALSYRIAHLVLHHGVDPYAILAVTFTNKAAREMRSRIETLFAEQESLQKHGVSLTDLDPADQTRLRSQVYRRTIKPLSIGTFHSLFARILRLEIEKFKDPKGRNWTRNFTIFDESDVQSLIKEIVVKQLNLDDRRFDPRSVRYAISNAKNQGWTPTDLEKHQPDFRGRTIARVYDLYEDHLAANNGLDFDNLLLIPVQLFRQQPEILDYWHQRFQHVLVDEYQDTNRTQYDLIQLLATNREPDPAKWNWTNRSIFVVGDADQSIYRFRGADFKILMEFQGAFGDGLPDDDTRTMVKLEENYRSTQTILAAANHLIENNTERIDKVLRATRGEGELILCHQADNELDEAEYIANQIRWLTNPDTGWHWGHFAILYRTNAQSRPLEEALMRAGIFYTVVGGLRFYDRKEIKDVIAYLRAIYNPADSVSLLRVINVPRRGIGKSTIDKLANAAASLNIPLWDVISDEASVVTLAGRSARAVQRFATVLKYWHDQREHGSATQILQGILDDSGYLEDLKSQGTDEAEERAQNVMELFNAARQLEEEQEDPSLESFLGNISLASDLDNLQETPEKVSLMTLHSSKGLEFPVVFLVGMEQGLFPNYRAMDDPAALEEERRLCYVGITRAQERLVITHARERRLYGQREPAIPSFFLGELPEELIQGHRPAIPRRPGARRSLIKPTTAPDPAPNSPSISTAKPKSRSSTPKPSPRPQAKIRPPQSWSIGDRIEHSEFGHGRVTHVFGSGPKITLAVKFPELGQQKILDPQISPIEKLS